MKMSFLGFLNSIHSLAHFLNFTTTFSTKDIVLGNYYLLGLQLIYVEGLIKGPNMQLSLEPILRAYCEVSEYRDKNTVYIRKIVLFDVRKTKWIQ